MQPLCALAFAIYKMGVIIAMKITRALKVVKKTELAVAFQTFEGANGCGVLSVWKFMSEVHTASTFQDFWAFSL